MSWAHPSGRELAEVSVNWSACATAGALPLVSPLQFIYTLTALPLIVIAPFTVQDISNSLLPYKLRKAVSVLPGSYLLAFIYQYFQYNWHELIKRNATIPLVTDIHLSCWRSPYIFRWWKTFLSEIESYSSVFQTNMTPVKSQPRLQGLDLSACCWQWEQWVVTQPWTKRCTADSGTEWHFQSAWGIWVLNENSTCTHSLTASLRGVFGFNSR